MKRCVIVGVGERGVRSYVAPIVKGHLSDSVKLVGIYDAVMARARLCSEDYENIPVFSDFETMLNKTKPDEVIVTTDDSSHHEYVIRALDFGCDVICEKPLTNSRAKALAIMEAEKRSGHKVKVIFNMRYMKPFVDFKRIIASGAIGDVRRADFSWLLDGDHGASYFRRWHRYLKNTNSLLIHKATHHFDVINWIMGGKVPKSVFARCYLDVYGKNGAFRGECCHKCDHTAECKYYTDITKHDFLKRYFYDIEEESGYYRDGCVFSEDIDIFDRMCLSVSYADGASMNYSLVAYSPDEGFKIDLVGTKGRAEFQMMSSGPGKKEVNEIRVIDEQGNEKIYETSMQSKREHGGADIDMRNDIFLGKDSDELGQLADSYAGYLSLSVGDMAVASSKLSREIFIDEL